MKIGDRVEHIDGRGGGFGRVMRVHADGSVDVAFPVGLLRTVPSRKVVNIESYIDALDLLGSVRRMVDGERPLRIAEAEMLLSPQGTERLYRAFHAIEERIASRPMIAAVGVHIRSDGVCQSVSGLREEGHVRPQRIGPFGSSQVSLAQLKGLLELEALIPAAIAAGLESELYELCESGKPTAVLDYLNSLKQLEHAVPEAAEIVRRQMERLVVSGHIALLEELLAASDIDWSNWFDPATISTLATSAQSHSAFVREILSCAQAGSLDEIEEVFQRYSGAARLSLEEYRQFRIAVIERIIPDIALDRDQIAALASPASAMLLRARAGSGKTRTLCARAALAIRSEKIHSNRVMVVAFNRAAADEVRTRMQGDFNCPDFENARTFHSLAFQLVQPSRKLLFDQGQYPSQRKQSAFVQKLLERLLDPAFKSSLYQFFRSEIGEIERIGRDLSPKDYRAFRRSLEQVSLKGERVKTTAAKFIADFLFEHDIPYSYRRVLDWNAFGQGKSYSPEFTVVANGAELVIEHWSADPREVTEVINEEGERIPAQWFRETVARKRFYLAERGGHLVETHEGELHRGRQYFEKVLKDRLEQIGVPCCRLTEDEIVRRVFQTEYQIARMAEQFLQFIQRAKRRCLSVEAVAQLIENWADSGARVSLFYKLALLVYREYEATLVAQGAMDFDDLLREAAEVVSRLGPKAEIPIVAGKSISVGDLRWLLIDEFQDFSELYYRLLSSIMRANPAIRIMAVGDDWQAINGFSGAELRFFSNFDSYFPGASRAVIATNYRSSRSVVAAGNRVMDSFGDPAKWRVDAPPGVIRLINVAKEWVEFRSGCEYESARRLDAPYLCSGTKGESPGISNLRLARVLKICVRIFGNSLNRRLLLLSRTRKACGLELSDFRARLVEAIVAVRGEDKHSLLRRIRVMTAHTAKGQEEDEVVIIDAGPRQFPLVHPDNLLHEIFGVNVEQVLAEERRLFYVAISRAAQRLWLLVDGDVASPFATGLADFEDAPPVNLPTDELHSAVAPSPLLSLLFEKLKSKPAENTVEEVVLGAPTSSWQMVSQSVIVHLREFVNSMAEIGGVPVPRPSYDLDDSGEAFAELAWPDRLPPLALLVGDQIDQRLRWQEEGWMVLTGEVALRQGARWLADQVALLEVYEGEVAATNPVAPRIRVECELAGLWHAVGEIEPMSFLSVGEVLILAPEPSNSYDPRAVRVQVGSRKIGYVPRAFSQEVSSCLERGGKLTARVMALSRSSVSILIENDLS